MPNFSATSEASSPVERSTTTSRSLGVSLAIRFAGVVMGTYTHSSRCGFCRDNATGLSHRSPSKCTLVSVSSSGLLMGCESLLRFAFCGVVAGINDVAVKQRLHRSQQLGVGEGAGW